MLAMVLFFSAGCGGTKQAAGPGKGGEDDLTAAAQKELVSIGGRIRNSAQLVGQIREGMRLHSAAITVSFEYGSDIFDELNGVIETWMEAALEETGAPDEGDYIRYQTGGYSYTSKNSCTDGVWHYSVRIVPVYYIYLSQEEEAGEAAKKLRRDLGFWPWTSDEEKIHRIYTWLCENVHYDKVHRKNAYYHRRSTAYAALVQRTATCQGYCTAMYRLLREEGIDCRIITGQAGSEELHAWLIAKLGGKWYLLDPTWDAGQEDHLYYLVGTEDLQTEDRKEHIPGEAFQTEAFQREHPMSETGYFDSYR